MGFDYPPHPRSGFDVKGNHQLADDEELRPEAQGLRPNEQEVRPESKGLRPGELQGLRPQSLKRLSGARRSDIWKPRAFGDGINPALGTAYSLLYEPVRVSPDYATLYLPPIPPLPPIPTQSNITPNFHPQFGIQPQVSLRAICGVASRRGETIQATGMRDY